MLQIDNEELYYKLPSYRHNKFTQHTKENIVYKTMMFLGHRFFANELRLTAEKVFGLRLNNQTAGHGLRILYENGYVTRERVVGTYVYYKTELYSREINGWLQENEIIQYL